MSDAKSRLAVYFHQDCLDYRVPDGVFDSEPSPHFDKQIEQPEGPDRIVNTRSILQRCAFGQHIDWLIPEVASDDQLLAFHSQPYLDRLNAADDKGKYFTRSTYLAPGAMHPIRLSAGCAIGAAGHVAAGNGRLSYALSRPPGHHAQPDEADGYCFINGVGLAVEDAISHGCERVAVIDWDVHHGNGTQQGFKDRDDVLTVSMHMDHGAWGSTHTQTGDVDEIGQGPGLGCNLNLPLPFGAGDRCYNQLFARCVVPYVSAFKPDLIVLANGQDANQFDPNGRQCLTMSGYYALATQLREMAESACDGKVVMTQEGGYNASYAPLCAYAVVAALLREPMEIEDPIAFYPDDRSRADREVEELIARHPLLG